MSNRQVATEVGIDRKTVAKVWNSHKALMNQLSECSSNDERRSIQDKITSIPTYDASNRKRRKFNADMEAVIDGILANEHVKDIKLGPLHKQRVTNVLIHQTLLDKGFDIGLTTVTTVVKQKKEKLKETFIRQTYRLGQRLEFDFGEVKLLIKGIYEKYYLAVLSSPASNYRMAYLYKNQDKKVFMDAHVRFFENVGGIYHEIVYDNMRNVVSRFIGRNDKILNDDLVKMSMYYGFDINVTNCFSGNEKGHVEGSVKHIRKQAFTLNYEFESFEQAQVHLTQTLDKINTKSTIEEEKKHLKAYKPKLELAEVSQVSVSKYSVIRVENNFYSVPEDLNGKDVTVKNYLNNIEVYYHHEMVCKHKKVDGYLEYVLDIHHYTKTLKAKPCALRNSQALANNTILKSIYEHYYTKKPKLFIELIEKNKHLKADELNDILLSSYNSVVQVEKLEEKIVNESIKQIHMYNQLLKGADYGPH